MEPGRLLAEGRDAQIFEFGTGRVLRRAKQPRSLAYEANTMALVRAFGVPAPRVDDVIEDDRAIVMERIEGPSLMDWALRSVRAPARVRALPLMLAELSAAIHRVLAPSWMRDAGDGGASVVHLDLHPLNVLMAPDGPVVIDWSNAARGTAATDDALSWLLIATGEPPPLPKAMLTLVDRLRARAAQRFVAAGDAAATRSALRYAAELRLCDGNTTEGERAAIAALLAREHV